MREGVYHEDTKKFVFLKPKVKRATENTEITERENQTPCPPCALWLKFLRYKTKSSDAGSRKQPRACVDSVYSLSSNAHLSLIVRAGQAAILDKDA